MESKKKLNTDPQFEKFVHEKQPKQTMKTKVNPFARKEIPTKKATSSNQTDRILS